MTRVYMYSCTNASSSVTFVQSRWRTRRLASCQKTIFHWGIHIHTQSLRVCTCMCVYVCEREREGYTSPPRLSGIIAVGRWSYHWKNIKRDVFLLGDSIQQLHATARMIHDYLADWDVRVTFFFLISSAWAVDALVVSSALSCEKAFS